MTINVEIPKWCLGKCNREKFRCCRCGKTLFIFYQEGDGKKIHSLCEKCFKYYFFTPEEIQKEQEK